MDFKAFESRYIYDPNKDQLGRGGFGTVYKAYDCKYGIHVAIKRCEVTDANEKYSLFNEVKRAKTLRHRNLIFYHDCFRFESQFGNFDYAIIDYCEEGGLNNLMEKELTLPQKEALVHGILKGLQYLHAHNIIHRDLKPHNILIDVEDGQWVPKIADFGLSRMLEGDLTMNSTVIHTPEYAAPEQITEDLSKIGAATDLWSLGVVLFELFTGQLPFGSRKNKDSIHTITQNILDAKLPESVEKIPEPYQVIIRCCLVRDIEKRVQSVEEIQALIKQVHQKEADSSSSSNEKVVPELPLQSLEEPDLAPSPTPPTQEAVTIKEDTAISSTDTPPISPHPSITASPPSVTPTPDKVSRKIPPTPTNKPSILQAICFFLYVGSSSYFIYNIFNLGDYSATLFIAFIMLFIYMGLWGLNRKNLFRDWGLHWLGLFLLISLGLSQLIYTILVNFDIQIDFLDTHPIINSALIAIPFLVITSFISLFNRSSRSSLNRISLWLVNNLAVTFPALTFMELYLFDPIIILSLLTSFWIVRSIFYFLENVRSLSSTDWAIQYWVWGGILTLPLLLAHHYSFISHDERPDYLIYGFATLVVTGLLLLLTQRKKLNLFSLPVIVLGLQTSILLLSTNMAYVNRDTTTIFIAIFCVLFLFLLFIPSIRRKLGMA